MTFNAETLLRKLRELDAVAGRPSRYIIAFSGGLDSTVLLHAVAALREVLGVRVLAIHVDHGLHEDSSAWSQQCREVADGLNVEFKSRSVQVQLESGKGPEASARDARYDALHSELGFGDWLMSAHHREDQAETLLLNLIRGSGPMGIAGIADIRRFGPGWLARPLLGTGRQELLDYANRESLRWIDDPSNVDRRFDRNFLRHDILPRLAARWPDIAARLQRSAGHASEASQLLSNLASIDLEGLGRRPERLPVDGLLGLSPARQRNLLRYSLRHLGLSTPTSMQLERILNEVLPARRDAQPFVSWPGAVVRRYRGRLYLLPEPLLHTPATIDVSSKHVPPDGAPEFEVPLGPGLGALRFQRDQPCGLSEDLLRRDIQIRYRQGGERFIPYGQVHTRKLKKLLQEEGVVPWMRDRLPLVYAGEALVAVGDHWLAANAVSEPGVALRWIARPALH
ncbi:MAG: tRNA lysidine(34) synthetase TilS [Woeseiaceae bacterium]